MSDDTRPEIKAPVLLTDEEWREALTTARGWQYNPEHLEDLIALCIGLTQSTMDSLAHSIRSRTNVDRILRGDFSRRISEVNAILDEERKWALSVNQGYDA